MPERGSELGNLADEVAQALVGDADPVHLEGFRFAGRILPAFHLIRSLFYQTELDTCLKLMILHELTRTGGRFSLERIRAVARFLDPDRVDALVRSLRDGRWLELRESDRTYAVSPIGVHILGLLYAADLGNLRPVNALARAAQNAAFGATLDGAEPEHVGYLLDQLLALLEAQVEEARAVLQHGRPHRLIEWSRREQPHQLETVQQVLTALQERLDASSRAFAQLVQLHYAMQEIIRQHNGIHGRLREWNIDRLHTAEAGYSIPQLLEAILGAEDTAMGRAVDEEIVRPPVRPPSLTFDELKERIHGARRKLASQVEEISYKSPPLPAMEPWSAVDLDSAAALRARLSELLANRSPVDEPLEIEGWRIASNFAEASFEVALLSRLQTEGNPFRLNDGRLVKIEQAAPNPSGVDAAHLLDWFVHHEALRILPEGLLSRVRLRLVEEAKRG